MAVLQYLLGLALAALAMPAIGIAVAHHRRAGTGRWNAAAIAIAATAAIVGGAAVLYSTMEGFHHHERAIDALEIVAAGLLPLAMLMPTVRSAGRILRVAAVALAVLVVASASDAIGLSSIVLGSLPGIGILPLRGFDVGHGYLVENDYCASLGNLAVSILGVVPFAALALVATKRRLRALMWAAFAGLMLYASSLLTRSNETCECYERVIPGVPRAEWTQVDCPLW